MNGQVQANCENDVFHVTSFDCWSHDSLAITRNFAEKHLELGTFDHQKKWHYRFYRSSYCYHSERRVVPTSYSVWSYGCGPGCNHLKSWVVEVSNDGSSWTEIDRRDNNVNDKYATANFKISRVPSESYRFFRLRQTGENHAGDYFVIEFNHFAGDLWNSFREINTNASFSVIVSLLRRDPNNSILSDRISPSSSRQFLIWLQTCYDRGLDQIYWILEEGESWLLWSWNRKTGTHCFGLLCLTQENSNWFRGIMAGCWFPKRGCVTAVKWGSKMGSFFQLNRRELNEAKNDV